MRKTRMRMAAGAVLLAAAWGWAEPPDEARGFGIAAGPAEQAEAPSVPAAWEGVAQAPRGRVTDGLVALYRGDALDAEGRIADRSGSAVGPDLEIRAVSVPAVRVDDGALAFGLPAERPVPGAFSRGPARAVIRALAQRGAFTIEAWVRPANTDQAGPTRIVSLSHDSGVPNVTLGQERSQFILRLRTSNVTGHRDVRMPAERMDLEAFQHVAATFDGEDVVLYHNGEEVARSADFAGTLENWDETFHLALGNEFTGDREWAGALRLVAIYAEALEPRQVARNHAAGVEDVE